MSTKASAIAAFLGAPLIGPDIVVRAPRSLANAAEGALLFANAFKEETARALAARGDVLVIAARDYAGHLKGPHILVERPRLEFARVCTEFFPVRPPAGISATAVIAPTAVLGKDVSVGDYTVIGPHVVIGDHTIIRDRVSLREGTQVGAHSLIKSNTVIGEEGFGFEFDEQNVPQRIQHYGRVRIGDHVEIGACVVIARGTLDDTSIGDHVKIDDHVFIAHNVQIGERSMVIAGAEVSGSVVIGAGSWIGPQACILNQVKLGEDAYVGIGAVVLKPVDANTIVVGNPAKPLRKRFER